MYPILENTYKDLVHEDSSLTKFNKRFKELKEYLKQNNAPDEYYYFMISLLLMDYLDREIDSPRIKSYFDDLEKML